MESLIILPVVYLTRQIDFTDEWNLFFARLAFFFSQLLAVAVWLWLSRLISARAGSAEMSRRLRIPRATSAWPQADAAERVDDEEEITVAEYDERELLKLRNQALTRGALVLAIHWYWAATIPLVIQVVSTPFSLWKEPLVRLYLRGEALRRPFPAPTNPLQQLFTGSAGGEPAEAPDAARRKKKRDRDGPHDADGKDE